jgi:hypothetical protein
VGDKIEVMYKELFGIVNTKKMIWGQKDQDDIKYSLLLSKWRPLEEGNRT